MSHTHTHTHKRMAHGLSKPQGLVLHVTHTHTKEWRKRRDTICKALYKQDSNFCGRFSTSYECIYAISLEGKYRLGDYVQSVERQHFTDARAVLTTIPSTDASRTALRYVQLAAISRDVSRQGSHYISAAKALPTFVLMTHNIAF
jgi:hypothetical protein